MSSQSSAGMQAPPLIFGTDGIRDRAGEGLLAADSIARVVGATAHALLAPSGAGETERVPRTVIVGRDTRSSGEGILAILEEEFTRRGFDVVDVGVLTTPGVAFTASDRPDVALGVMISASHNPPEYNGIKFFSPRGTKVSETFERVVSDGFHRGADSSTGSGAKVRREQGEAFESYVAHLVSCCRNPQRLRDQRIALDTANGASYRVAPEVFRRLGAVVEAIGEAPDGSNINQDCGALHPEKLAEVVREADWNIGFCFDGDGDRMVPIGALGTVFDGDHVLFLAACRLQAENRLPNATVVGTSMSNFGLEKALGAKGIRLLRTDVGDRNVYREMERSGYPLGGEQSGHTIFLEDARTGDGILSALRLIDALPSEALDLEHVAAAVPRFPQLIENVRVHERVPFDELPGVARALRCAADELEGRGRIVLRYSGTEPLARVMVESDDAEMTARIAGTVARAVASELGSADP